MKENSYNLTTRIDAAEVQDAGIAYIILPSDVDRDTYIRQCYKSGTVSIFSEHNGYSNRVPIDRYSLNFITFPKTIKEFGSAVSFIAEPINKRPIITGIYFKNDELAALQENQFKFKRELEGNVVEITGSPATKSLHLNVIADEAGEISIKVSSVDQSANVNIDVSGDVNVNATGNVNFIQGNQFNVTTIADTDDDSKVAVFKQSATSHLFADEEHNISTDKFSINAGQEPFVLGKKFADFTKKLIDKIGNSTVTTSLGQMPLLNKEEILSMKGEVESMLSEVGFIDK